MYAYAKVMYAYECLTVRYNRTVLVQVEGEQALSRQGSVHVTLGDPRGDDARSRGRRPACFADADTLTACRLNSAEPEC